MFPTLKGFRREPEPLVDFCGSVGRIKNLRSGARNPLDGLEQLGARTIIEPIANFVKDEDARFAGERAGNENLSQFAGGKLLDIPRQQRLDS